MALTDAQCRAAKGRERSYKLGDSQGLYLFVTPSGFRSWRWKYRFDRKEKRLVLGSYPDMKLADARIAREDAARLLRSGIDPSGAPAALPHDLESYARDWHAEQFANRTERHREKALKRLEKHVFSKLGKRPVGAIKTAEIRNLLKSIQQAGGTEAAHRMRGFLVRIFHRAKADGLVEANPVLGLEESLRPIARKGAQPALVDLEEARAFLRAVEALDAQPITRLASRLLALTAVRPGVIRYAEPKEFRLTGEHPEWRVPAAKMKLELKEKEQAIFDLVVPLSKQAVDVVQEALKLQGRRPGCSRDSGMCGSPSARTA